MHSIKKLANGIIPLIYESTKQDLTETINRNSTNFTDAASGQYTALSQTNKSPQAPTPPLFL